MSVEALLIAELAAELSVPVVADVPPLRPVSFVTVERTGGPEESFRSVSVVAVQCWAASRYLASVLADLVVDALRGIVLVHPDVGRVSVLSVYNNPDPDSGQARYQINVELVTV